jgi:hypothetical protein
VTAAPSVTMTRSFHGVRTRAAFATVRFGVRGVAMFAIGARSLNCLAPRSRLRDAIVDTRGNTPNAMLETRRQDVHARITCVHRRRIVVPQRRDAPHTRCIRASRCRDALAITAMNARKKTHKH